MNLGLVPPGLGVGEGGRASFVSRMWRCVIDTSYVGGPELEAGVQW